MKITYVPDKSLPNSYASRMQEIFASYGELENFLSLKVYFKMFFVEGPNTKDVLVLNWFENKLCNIRKPLTLSGTIKFILHFFILRLLYKKILWVHHNNYPHDCRPIDISFSSTIINILESYCDGVFIHVPILTNNRTYVPHPLFHRIEAINKTNQLPFPGKEYFIIFGRIEPYKNLEFLIDNFPDNQNLVIAGSCSDLAYLDQLKQRVRTQNISITGELISDEKAQNLVQNSKGLIVAHQTPHFLMSGSLMFGLSMGVNVFTLKTFVTDWLISEVKNSLFVADNITSLLVLINKPLSFNKSADLSNFKDDKIFDCLNRFLQKNINKFSGSVT